MMMMIENVDIFACIIVNLLRSSVINGVPREPGYSVELSLILVSLILTWQVVCVCEISVPLLLILRLLLSSLGRFT